MSETNFPQLTEAEQNVRRVALIILKGQSQLTDTAIHETIDFAKQASSNSSLDLAAIFISVKNTITILAAEAHTEG